MKCTMILSLLIAITVASCSSTHNTVAPEQKIQVAFEDSLDHELVVLDPGFDTFLVTQPSAEFFSQSYYESWNLRYVTEWNMRHRSPLRHGDFYQTEIHYVASTDYGLDLNYRLYNYFLFIERQYGIRLINRARR
jgi:hypothetical protein